MIALWLAWASAAELTVWHAYSGAEEAALVEAGRAYTDETGTAVRTVAIPFGAFDSKVETAIPRGNGPDLFIAAHGSLGGRGDSADAYRGRIRTLGNGSQSAQVEPRGCWPGGDRL